jgi:hypothetical protein
MATIQQTNDTSHLVDIPTQIINYLEKKSKRLNFVTRGRCSVTDIVGCQRRSYYQAAGFEEEQILNDNTIENMWDSVRGELLHNLTCRVKPLDLILNTYDIDNNR